MAIREYDPQPSLFSVEQIIAKAHKESLGLVCFDPLDDMKRFNINGDHVFECFPLRTVAAARYVRAGRKPICKIDGETDADFIRDTLLNHRKVAGND